jgi:hypothetical protein
MYTKRCPRGSAGAVGKGPKPWAPRLWPTQFGRRLSGKGPPGTLPGNPSYSHGEFGGNPEGRFLRG